MKKIICLLLALVLCTLCACSEEEALSGLSLEKVETFLTENLDPGLTLTLEGSTASYDNDSAFPHSVRVTVKDESNVISISLITENLAGETFATRESCKAFIGKNMLEWDEVDVQTYQPLNDFSLLLELIGADTSAVLIESVVDTLVEGKAYTHGNWKVTASTQENTTTVTATFGS